MSLSIFGDKATVPRKETLAEALADSVAYWDTIPSQVTAVCGSASEEWKFYSKKAGWSLVIKSGKRTIVYLIPQEGFFKAGFVFGEKAVAAAQSVGLPEALLALINEAEPYVEGRSFMLDIKTEADTATTKKLIELKNAH